MMRATHVVLCVLYSPKQFIDNPKRNLPSAGEGRNPQAQVEAVAAVGHPEAALSDKLCLVKADEEVEVLVKPRLSLPPQELFLLSGKAPGKCLEEAVGVRFLLEREFEHHNLLLIEALATALLELKLLIIQ